MKTLCQTVAIAALGMMLTGAKADTQSQNINVVVDNQPIDFSGAPPQEVDGSVLVPLRGVFERLGAHVHYNPVSRTITADDGATNISLTLGSSTAYVNQQVQQLSEPAKSMDGTTLVPLRFVAEALGAYVEWHATTNTVQIISNGTHSASSVPMSDVNVSQDVNSVSGRITNIDTSASPEVITVHTDSGPVQANVTDRTDVIRLRSDGTQKDLSSSDLREGQVITLKMRSNGNARTIEIKAIDENASEVHGRIISLDNDGNPNLLTIATDTGHIQVGVNSDTIVNKGRLGAPVEMSAVQALHAGEHVSVRTHADGSAISIHIYDPISQ
jgi:hypothetical protein